MRLFRLWFCLYLVPVGAQISDPNFVIENLHFGNGTTAIDFLPDGEMIAAEKRGALLVFTPDGSGSFNTATTLLDISGQVDSSQEAGLLGLAVDPEFALSRRIFLFYTTSSDQRVTSVTVNALVTGIDPGSEAVLLSGFPRDVAFHKAGDIEFQPGDPANLYISIGDDGPTGLLETVGVPRVQDPDFYNGKILKINKNNGQGLSDNPFFAGDPNTIRARVWALGFRNPFRFCFHPDVPNQDVLYSSENGDATDRLSWVFRGSNGSWSAAGDNGGFLDPPDPNHRVMTTIDPSQIGVAIATTGPFAIGGQPTLYTGNWYPSPYGIYRWQLTGADLDGVTLAPGDSDPLLANDTVAVDLTFGPNGALYFCETGGGASTGSFNRVRRLRFIGGTPPTASLITSPSPARGELPLQVNFTDTSTAATGASLTNWAWTFGDGTSSSLQDPSHVFGALGVFTVSLQVTDSNGLQDTRDQLVTVYRTVSLSLDGQIFDGRALPEVALGSATELGFYQTDGTTPLPFSGGGGIDGNRLIVSAGGVIGTTLNLEILDDGVVISAGEASGDGVRTGKVGFTIPSGLSSFSANANFYLSPTMVRGRVSDPRGFPIHLDIGSARLTVGNFINLAGGRDHASLPSGSNYRRESDDLGFYHIALPDGSGNASFFFDLPGDIGAAIYAPRLLEQPVNEGAEVIQDILVGLFGGGSSCSDLSSIPSTPGIDYGAQIQPIWDSSCTGCHNPTAENSGGLDLTGNSSLNLVNVESGQIPGLMLVTPGDTTRSFLFEKINCADPQIGTRMRPTETMDPAQQALIRDWILDACMVVIGPASANYDETGGSGSITTTAQTGCAWTAVSNDAWITVTAGGAGNGNGAVSYSVAANSSISSRIGTITVAGNTFSVSQDGEACVYSINPSSANYNEAGGGGSLAVSAQAGCAWTAVSNDNWITVTEGGAGGGNGTVSYIVAGNGSVGRSGTITVAEHTFTVNQNACSYTITPGSAVFNPNGNSGSVLVTATNSCAWTAISNVPWITIDSGGEGVGTGMVTYSVTANPSSSARGGTLTVAGQIFSLIQSGACVPDPSFFLALPQWPEQNNVLILATMTGCD